MKPGIECLCESVLGPSHAKGGELTCGGFLAKLDHLAQTYTSRWELGVVLDGIHQRLRRLPRHDGGVVVDCCVRSYCTLPGGGIPETNRTAEVMVSSLEHLVGVSKEVFQLLWSFRRVAMGHERGFGGGRVGECWYGWTGTASSAPRSYKQQSRGWE